MKNKIFLCFIICSFLFSFFSCSEVVTSDVNSSSDSILYNNYFNYSSKDIFFLIKERGYDFIEEYNGNKVEIQKKELSVSMIPKDFDNDFFYYEIYEDNNILIKGILYLEENSYESNIVIKNVGELKEPIKVNILDSNNNILHSFNLKKEVIK